MRATLWFGLMSAFLLGKAVQGQGTVNFNTRVIPDVDVKVFHWDGITPLAGDGFTAQLFGGMLGAGENSLAPLYPVTGFLTGSDAGYVVPVEAVEIPGIAEGGSASLMLRVWENQGQQISTYDQARMQGVFHGQSAIFDVAWLGGGVHEPANLTGLQSFALIPEPRVVWYLVVGLGLLGLRKGREAGDRLRIDGIS
jgi:hypothetical protein